MYRLVGFCLVALIVGWIATVQAADTHQGKVVSTSAGKLTMTDLEGKNQHTMDVAPEAMVMRDGKDSTLAALKSGDTITVTTEKTGNTPTVMKVEAKSADS